MKEDIIGFAMLGRAPGANAEDVATGLQRWCSTLGGTIHSCE